MIPKMEPCTADKLDKLIKYLDKLQKDLGNNGSRRDEEISSSLFSMISIITKMVRACNTNDIDTEQRIAKSLYELYQNYIKELI